MLIYLFIYLFLGNIIGQSSNWRRVINGFRLLRRNMRKYAFVSVYPKHLHRSVYISTDGGRLCRPYIIIDQNGESRVNKEHLMFLRLKVKNFQDFLDEALIE